MSISLKHLRDFEKKLGESFPGVSICLLRQRTHFIYEITYRGVARRFALGKSPRCVEHAIDNTLKDVRRNFAAAQKECLTSPISPATTSSTATRELAMRLRRAAPRSSS